MGMRLPQKPVTEDQLLTNELSMDRKIEIAQKISNTLKPLLKDNNLVVKIGGGKEYVTAEGWNTLGTLLGLSPVTEYVKPLDMGPNVVAFVSAVSIMKGDTIISRAESIATSRGKQKEDHAIYSMAQTRAMGKAYRMALSWIMTLAGYEVTPAEEMNIGDD